MYTYICFTEPSESTLQISSHFIYNHFSLSLIEMKMFSLNNMQLYLKKLINV